MLVVDRLYRLTASQAEYLQSVIKSLGQADPGLGILKKNGLIHIAGLHNWLSPIFIGLPFNREYLGHQLRTTKPRKNSKNRFQGNKEEYIEALIDALKFLVEDSLGKNLDNTYCQQKEHLNAFLESNFDLGSWCEIVPASINDSSFGKERRKSKELNSGKVSYALEISQDLLSIDYWHQEADCRRAIGRLVPASALLCSTSDQRVQRWIVKRIESFIGTDYASIKNAKKIEFFARSHPMNANFINFWKDLAAQMEINESDESSIVGAMCERLEKTSIIIAIYGIDGLSPENQKAFIEMFWGRVCQQLIRSLERMPRYPRRGRSRLILLLTERGIDGRQRPYQCVTPSQAEHPNIPVLLEPLTEISLEDVWSWIDNPTIISRMEEMGHNPDEIYNLLAAHLPETEPAVMLDALCCALNLERGLNEVEEYWRLAG
jgi:hypothetical protein